MAISGSEGHIFWDIQANVSKSFHITEKIRADFRAGGFISTYGSSSNYNALQVALNRRMGRDLMLGVNYTWSKAMGTDTDYQFVGNPLNHRKADYSLLTFDRTQDLVFN
jgi:hypothetical protein